MFLTKEEIPRIIEMLKSPDKATNKLAMNLKDNMKRKFQRKIEKELHNQGYFFTRDSYLGNYWRYDQYYKTRH